MGFAFLKKQDTTSDLEEKPRSLPLLNDKQDPSYEMSSSIFHKAKDALYL